MTLLETSSFETTLFCSDDYHRTITLAWPWFTLACCGERLIGDISKRRCALLGILSFISFSAKHNIFASENCISDGNERLAEWLGGAGLLEAGVIGLGSALWLWSTFSGRAAFEHFLVLDLLSEIGWFSSIISDFISSIAVEVSLLLYCSSI